MYRDLTPIEQRVIDIAVNGFRHSLPEGKSLNDVQEILNIANGFVRNQKNEPLKRLMHFLSHTSDLHPHLVGKCYDINETIIDLFREKYVQEFIKETEEIERERVRARLTFMK